MADDPVRIREVGPRDGFQNEPETIATDDKVRLVEMLARTGLRRLEATIPCTKRSPSSPRASGAARSMAV